MFEGGGAAAEGTASEAQVDLLYRRIGQPKVENDFLYETPGFDPGLDPGRAERRALVERENSALPVSQQCRLPAVSRSLVYRRPTEVSEEDFAIMALIDWQYLARPYYGSRRMASWLATRGQLVNRKRVRRLMRLMGLVAIW